MKVILTKIDSKVLVKEHKDYTSEFDEITDLIERKKDLRIR